MHVSLSQPGRYEVKYSSYGDLYHVRFVACTFSAAGALKKK
ncbi:hypothetical protein SAMN04488057_103167 [Cyclobacterium lianum]|uniref:Uncharacterized protein n=2 Tax=Cyclobacterium lianum TaxID=388280 RepID=A0A1M7L970_9BACT|nr:hypothetical protein SAMN04488057_103167 [Cyclobacterium lianum]